MCVFLYSNSIQFGDIFKTLTSFLTRSPPGRWVKGPISWAVSIFSGMFFALVCGKGKRSVYECVWKNDNLLRLNPKPYVRVPTSPQVSGAVALFPFFFFVCLSPSNLRRSPSDHSVCCQLPFHLVSLSLGGRGVLSPDCPEGGRRHEHPPHAVLRNHSEEEGRNTYITYLSPLWECYRYWITVLDLSQQKTHQNRSGRLRIRTCIRQPIQKRGTLLSQD